MKLSPKFLFGLLGFMFGFIVVMKTVLKLDNPELAGAALAVEQDAEPPASNALVDPAFTQAPDLEFAHPRVATRSEVEAAEAHAVEAEEVAAAIEITQPMRVGPSIVPVESYTDKPAGYDARLAAKLKSRKVDPAIVREAELQTAAFLGAQGKDSEETVQGKPARQARIAY